MNTTSRFDPNFQGPHFRGMLPSGALLSSPSPPLAQHFRSVTEFLIALTAYAVAHLPLTPSDIPNGDSLGFPSTCGEIRNGTNTGLTPRSPATPPQPLPTPSPSSSFQPKSCARPLHSTPRSLPVRTPRALRPTPSRTPTPSPMPPSPDPTTSPSRPFSLTEKTACFILEAPCPIACG